MICNKKFAYNPLLLNGIFQDWGLAHSKGCFFFEDDGSIISHLYRLDVPKDTKVYITIEPFAIRGGGKYWSIYNNSALKRSGEIVNHI